MSQFIAEAPNISIGGRTARLGLVCDSGVKVEVSVPVPDSARAMDAEAVEDAVCRAAAEALEAAAAQLRRTAAHAG